MFLWRTLKARNIVAAAAALKTKPRAVPDTDNNTNAEIVPGSAKPVPKPAGS